MATWTNIADTVLEPGKPIRAIDARALRDNPIAIAQGASGAPKIETAGIDDDAVTTAKIADDAVTTSKIADANVTAAKLNVLTRSFSGGLLAGFTATLVSNDTLAFMPRLTTASSTVAIFRGNPSGGTGLRVPVVNFAEFSQGYAAEWRYIP